MTLLNKFRTGWKKLDTILDAYRDAINARSVSTGSGIDLQASQNGCVLSLAVQTTQDPASANNPSTGPGTGSGGTPTDLTALTARIAALEAILAGSNWTGVDVMNSSCVRSTINVLTH